LYDTDRHNGTPVLPQYAVTTIAAEKEQETPENDHEYGDTFDVFRDVNDVGHVGNAIDHVQQLHGGRWIGHSDWTEHDEQNSGRLHNDQ